MKIIFILITFLISNLSLAEIKIDGKLDEQEWSSAQSFTQMKVVEPYTLLQPKYHTEVLITSDEAGIYFGVRNFQPRETRNNDTSARDQRIGSDKVEIMIDFNANAITAYSFQVGNGGSIRDGTFSSESGFSNEWDGNWQGAYSENDDYWASEMYIPWDVVSMKKSDDGKRTLNWYIIRSVANESEFYANVESSEFRPRFLNDFASVTIQDYADSSLQLFGYGTARRDFHNQKTTADSGIDLFWKSGNGKQLTATINPDFGQIESDRLVVNFSATETFFNERRPFFTENQTLFNVIGVYGLRMLHTRRIGARPDQGTDLASDIDAAIKLTDNRDNYTYGLFAASESSGDGYEGRNFYAGRFLHKTDKQTIGLTTTYVDRPDIDRNALSYAFNYDYLMGDKVTIKTQLIGSSIDDNNQKNTGYGAWATLSHQISENQIQTFVVNHFDEDFEINDFGFLPRNNLNSAFYVHSLKKTNFSEESNIQQREFLFNTEYLGNDNGETLGSSYTFSDNWQFKDSSSFNWDVRLFSKGVNDLVSRGNGLVNIDSGHQVGVSYRSSNASKFRYHGFLRRVDRFSQGTEYETHIHPSYFFKDNYSISLGIFYSDSNDWLNWIDGDLFGRYKRKLLNSTLDFNANFSAKQELRFRLQWFALDAQANSQYQLDTQGNLNAIANEINDFSLSNTALQIRYRYEVAPLSNIYVVYSRGASIFDEQSESVFSLFNPGFENVNSDNFLIKFRYKFF